MPEARGVTPEPVLCDGMTRGEERRTKQAGVADFFVFSSPI
jgi:hypothetical protein